MPSKVSIMTFESQKDRDKALDLFKDSRFVDAGGKSLLLKPALSFSSRERNKALIRANRLLEDFLRKEDSPERPEIDWKERKVWVSGEVAFSQAKEGLGGEFLGPFAGLLRLK